MRLLQRVQADHAADDVTDAGEIDDDHVQQVFPDQPIVDGRRDVTPRQLLHAATLEVAEHHAHVGVQHGARHVHVSRRARCRRLRLRAVRRVQPRHERRHRPLPGGAALN